MSQLSIMIIIPNKQRFLRNVYNIRWMGLIIETTLKSAQACFILPWLVSSIWLKTMVSVSPRPNLRSDQCLAAIIFYRLPQLAPGRRMNAKARAANVAPKLQGIWAWMAGVARGSGIPMGCQAAEASGDGSLIPFKFHLLLFFLYPT